MRNIILLALACAMLTGCSSKIDPSPEVSTPETKISENDSIETDTQKGAVFGVFNCGNELIGGDGWWSFDNGYTPDTSLSDGEFLAVNADVTYLHGSESGYSNAPVIDRLISETPLDFDSAIDKFSIPMLGEKGSLDSHVAYYRNFSGTYVTAVTDNIRIYLNGDYVCDADWNDSETLKALYSDPELLEALRNGRDIPPDGSYVAEVFSSGASLDIAADSLQNIIFESIGNMANYNDLPTEEYTEDFDKKCKTEGLYAKLYFTEEADLEVFGNTYDTNYLIVAAESTDSQPYFSINGEGMKPFPKEYTDKILSEAQ